MHDPADLAEWVVVKRRRQQRSPRQRWFVELLEHAVQQLVEFAVEQQLVELHQLVEFEQHVQFE